MTIDTGRPTVINASLWKALGLAAAGLAMSAASATLAFAWLPDLEADLIARIIGFVGLAFFACCAGVAIWRLATLLGPIVTLSPQGIRDIRIAADTIPWSAIADITTWQRQGQKFMVLTLDPEVEARLQPTTIARWTRGANRGLGADGLCISAEGLTTDHDTLLRTTLAYAQAAQGRS